MSNEWSDDMIRRLRNTADELGWNEMSKEELTEEISNALQELVEQGLAERLIGEDGRFYYRHTNPKNK
jgi:predicted transcriptional regulator